MTAETPVRVLAIDDEPAILFSLRKLLDRWTVETAENPVEGLRRATEEEFDVLIVDYRMPGLDGLALLERLAAEDGPSAGAERILLTAWADKDLLAAALNRRLADRVLEKPLDAEALVAAVETAVESVTARRARARELALLREEAAPAAGGVRVIGARGGLAGVLAQVEAAAPHPVDVLLLGETGTGKELVARLVHDRSPRRDGPFVKVNCAAIPGTLVESELFGHVKGAFTDAKADRAGRLELAHGGTLFLDEIGELAADVQAKLLRALQDREVVRVGGTRPVRTDFRLVSATNRDLAAAMRDKTFREDLYYRVSAVPVALPALRERVADIVELAAYFCDRFAREWGLRPPALAADVGPRLARHPWPGNVRELENAVKRVLITLGGRATVTAADFVFLDGAGAALSYEAALDVVRETLIARKFTIDDVDDHLLANILAAYGDDVPAAVAATGIAKNRFYRLRGRLQ